jgi:O-antigen/teichoic acid export membrane protein
MKISVDKSLITKLTKTGFFHIFGSSVINQIITFLSGIILIRVLSKTEYGVYSYANNIMSFFLLFSGLGIVSGILQLSSENIKNPNKTILIFKYGSKVALGFNIFLSLIIFCFAIIIPFEVDGAKDLLIIMSLVPIVSVAYELIQIYFRYNRLNRNYSYFTTINTVTILTFSVAGALISQASGLVLLRYIGYLFTILLGILIFKFPINTLKFNDSLKKDDKKDLLKLSFVSMSNIATGQLIYILDIFIIGLIIPNESIIASFKVATIIPNALIFIPGSLMMYVYPYFASHNNDKHWVKKNFNLIIKYFGLFNLFLTVVLILLAPIIIRLVFGSQYLDSVAPFRVLVISYFFSATFRKVTGNLLVTQRKLKFNFWLGVFEGVFNIISNILLISYFGSLGASVTSLLIVVLSSTISVIYFIKVLKD